MKLKIVNQNFNPSFRIKANRKRAFSIQANSLSSGKYTRQTNARSAVVINFASVSQASEHPNPRCILTELTFPASTINRVYATAYCMAASLWRTLTRAARIRQNLKCTRSKARLINAFSGSKTSR